MNSFISYFGGKSLLAKQIIPLIPEHHCYCEVFSGAAWILFKKPISRVEILNDINSNLVTLFRVVQNHQEEFLRNCKWMLTAREEFDRMKLQPPGALTDIQKAVQFYYLLKTSYGSRMVNPFFSSSAQTKPRFNSVQLKDTLEFVHERLSQVMIENLHYSRCIEKFDRPATFFYLDPPYYGKENFYGHGIFQRDDYQKLSALLKGIQGKFIFSINDTPEIRQIFADFHLEEVSTTYSVSNATKGHRIKELLFMNFLPNIGTPTQGFVGNTRPVNRS